MRNRDLLGPWVRRFLLEHIVAERNLARNTQLSYRDTLSLLLPFAAKQASCGVDIVKVRKAYPKLQLMGGIPKSEIAKGPKRIEEILEPVKYVLGTGGYIPFGDHLIPPEVHWDEFSHYRRRLNELIDGRR